MKKSEESWRTVSFPLSPNVAVFHFHFRIHPIHRESRDSSVGIMTGYELDNQGVGIRVQLGARIFTSSCRPDRFWVSPTLLSRGRATAQAVSRWLPTAAARVRAPVWSSGICGGQSGAVVGFLRVLRFPLPFIPPNSQSSQSPGAGTIGQKWPTWRVDPVSIHPPLCEFKN
jgi:hypothetical protein